MPSLDAATTNLRIARAFVGAGVIAPMSLRTLTKMRRARRAYGASLGSLSRIAAIREPRRTALVDDRGTLTFGELDRRVDALAAALHARHGVDERSSVALLCRNHRGPLEALLAASRLGAQAVLLNTDFSTPQLAQSLARECPTHLVVDDEFLATVDASGTGLPRIVAWDASGASHGHDTLDELAAMTAPRPPLPSRPGRVTILTSGTTGMPRGAPRPIGSPQTFGLAATALARTGLRSGDPIMVASPLFHGFGLGVWVLSLSLRSPVVLMRRFDAARALRLVEHHGIVGIGLVPLMMHRLLAASTGGASTPSRSSIRAVLCAGAPLTPELASRTAVAWGDVLYNAYGSSEVGIATFGDAHDMRAQTGSVGRAIFGYSVAILDDTGRELPAGTPGRIFVGGPMVFGGY